MNAAQAVETVGATTDTFWLDHSGARVRLVAQGELDLASASAFCEALLGLFAVGRAVEVDLGKVTFLDASCVALLEHAVSEAHARGSEMTITGASKPVARVFFLCDAASILFSDRDDSLRTADDGPAADDPEVDGCEPAHPATGEYVVHAPDELDWESSAPFVLTVGRAVNRAVSERLGSLAVDMTATAWLDSDGVRALVQSTTHANDAGLTVRLVGTNATVRRIIDLAALGDFLGLA